MTDQFEQPESEKKEINLADLRMPDWMKDLNALTVEERQEVEEEFDRFARGSRAKRERFAVLFADREGWEEEFGPDFKTIG